MARNKKKRKQYVNPNLKNKNNNQEEEELLEGEETLVDMVEAQEVAQDFFEANQKTILSVLAAIVLIVGGYMAYSLGVKGPNEKAAQMAIYKAQEQFARDSFALALENPGGGFDGFLDIIDSYGSTKAGNLAKYYAGVSYLNLGRYPEAIDYLNSYSAKDEVTPIMKAGALGDAYAENGDLDQALSQYKKAANAENNEFLTPYYLYKYAILSKKQGNTSDAAAAFERIQKEYPDSSEASEAERYAAMLK